MATDILLQIGLILISLFMFLAIYDLPKKTLSKLRFRNRADLQAKTHFVRGAQLLAKARSSNSHPIAKQALDEAENAIALDPKDAAPHILKALVLDFQGFKTSALDSLDVALSPLAVKSLSGEERGDALFKRAELKMAVSRRGRVDSVVEDLTRAVELGSDNAKVYCLLGECYETKKMREDAKKAYIEALRVEPKSSVAREALDRLG